MKRLAILAAIIGVGLLAGSAQADVITNTYNLGPQDGGTTISAGGSIEWIAQGTLPAGSILRSVSINARLDDNPGGSWASDLNVLVDGLLQIGSDGGSPDWANGQSDVVGTTVIDSKTAGVDFLDTIDLNTAGLFLKNTWGDATWSGTVTVTYDAPNPASILTFGLPGNPAVIDWVATNIAWKVPYGTSVTNLAPTYTLAVGATCDPASGSTNNFTTPQLYTVISGDTTVTNVYTVTVTVAPPGPGGVNGGVALWLKADAINTNDAVTQVRLSGSDVFVKQWNDQGDVGNNASNGTDGDQPQYIAGALNGKPVLRFVQDDDDNGDRLYLGDLSAQFPSAGSIFVVATINTDGRYNLFGNRDNDERWVADTWGESHPGSFRGGRADGTFTQGSWPTTGSHVYALESSSAIFRMLIDGAQIGSDSADYNNGSGQNWTIGNRATSGQPLNGDIAELILFDRVLTTEEAEMVGGYLADKYGITTAYPPSTPQAKIRTFGPGAVINQATTNITWAVPWGSDVSKLAPTFNVSIGATADPVSGSTNNFITPQTYTIISSDSALTNVYTVTVTVLALPVTAGLACWYDAAVGVATNASGVILTWDDQSGNAHHGTAAFDPVLATNQVNSLPAAQFRGNYLDLAGTFFAKEQYVVVCSPNETWNNFGAFLGRISGRASTYLLDGTGNTGFWNDQNPDSVSKNGTVLTVPFELAPITNYMIVKITVNDADTSAASNQIGRVDGYSCDMDIAEIIAFTNALSAGDEALLGSYLADKYGLTTAYPVTPQAKILTFGPGAVITVTNISWTVPFGTAVTNLAPTFTMSSGATCDKTSGSTNNFSSPVPYTVTSSDSLLTNVYTVTVNLGPASTNKSILSFGPGAVIAGTNITWTVPYGTAVTNLAPTFAVSDFANCVPASGSTNNFTTPLKYTVTAQDSSTREYLVTVTVALPGPPVSDYTRWFDASTLGLGNGASVTQWDDGSTNAANATVPAGNANPTYAADAGTETHLGAVYFARNSGAGDSGSLSFTRDSSIRTVFSVFKGNSFLLTDTDAYHFHRPSDDSPTDPLWAGYASGDIIGGSTYVNGVIVDGTSFNMPTDVHNGFNLVEVLTTGNVQADSFNKDRTFHAGDQYQAEVIIYDRVLSEEERVLVEHYLMSKWFGVSFTPEAKILTFGPGAVINQTTTNISWTVPFGTAVTNLAPTFTISAGATCDKGSGSTNNFSSPVQYTVTSSDNLITNVYIVSVTVVSPPGGVGDGLVAWFDASQLTGLNDGDSVTAWTDSSGNAHTATRTGGTLSYATNQVNGTLPVVQFRDSAYADVAGTLFSKEQYIVFRLPNPSGAGEWGSVLGSQTESGYLLNRNGTFWDGRPADGVSQNGTAVGNAPYYNLTDIGNFMVLKITGNSSDPNVRSGWALGRQEGWYSPDMDVAEIIAFDQALSVDDENLVGSYLADKYGLTTAYPPVGNQAKILTFGPGAVINHTTTNIVWTVPWGTAVTNLAPTYTVSAGATCDRPSGSTNNFSSPVEYTVTSSDSLITNIYTVTVNVTPASTNKSIITFGLPGFPALITGTNVAWSVPFGTDVTKLAPVFGVSPFAVCIPASGSTNDFTNPVKFTVTAQDSSTKEYAVTVTVLPDWPTMINVNYSGDPGTASMNGIYSYDATASGSASHVAPAEYSGNAWNDFVSNPRATSTDLLDSKGASTSVGLVTTCNNGPWADWYGLNTNRMLLSAVVAGYTQFNPVFTLSGLNTNHAYSIYIASLQHDNVKPADFLVGAVSNHLENAHAADWTAGDNYVHFASQIPGPDGKIEVKAKCGGGWDGIVLNGFQVQDMGVRGLNREALLYSFDVPGATPTVNGTGINVPVPAGTDVSALSPVFTMSVGASCDHISGNPYDFSSSLHYKITSEDSSTTNDYIVTVTFVTVPVARGLACWYDASAGITEDGEGVLAWEDKSGNGHHATRGSGTVSLAPSEVNSLPAVHLRGGNTFLNCAGGMFTKEQYFVVRSPNTNWNGTGSFLGRASSDFLAVRASSYNMASDTTGFWQDHFPSAVSKNGTAVAIDIPYGNGPGYRLYTITNYMILKIIVDDSADNENLRTYPYYQIGKNETLGTMDFDVAEIIGFTNSLSTADEALVGAYLAAKYAISATYPPFPPAGLTAIVPGTGTIVLNWSAAFGATDYNVKRSTTSGSGFATIGTTSDTNYTDSTVLVGTNYFYVVSATNINGESANSAQVRATVPSPGMIISIH